MNAATLRHDGGDSGFKARNDEDRQNLRKREQKTLAKSLQLAQISTASMGQFDKKAGKKGQEPDAPKS